MFNALILFDNIHDVIWKHIYISTSDFTLRDGNRSFSLHFSFLLIIWKHRFFCFLLWTPSFKRGLRFSNTTKLAFTLSSGMVATWSLVLQACDRKNTIWSTARLPSHFLPNNNCHESGLVWAIQTSSALEELLIGQKEWWLYWANSQRWIYVTVWMHSRVLLKNILPAQKNLPE